MAKFTGTGKITAADFVDVKWVGKSKGGKAVTIKITDAINMSNINLGLVEKDDVVPSITFMGTYSNTDETATATAEPWSIETTETSNGADGILLGCGIFYVDDVAVALCRGGGSFDVEREFREINADGDRGAVKGRVELEGSRPSITMNALTFLVSMDKLFPAVSKTAE